MLISMKDVENCTIAASDGAIGTVKDFYFDDDAWVVRYLVVQTDSWLSQRKVLISPVALGTIDLSTKSLAASLTQAQVRNSPDIDTAKPVSRQHEVSLLDYYGYPFYWRGNNVWVQDSYPGALELPEIERAYGEKMLVASQAERQRGEDPHLRSANTIVQYCVHATDGDIGHVRGLLMDERTWAIRYLLVNTSHWWLDHEVLISPEWISDISWSESKVSVDLARKVVQGLPAYHSPLPVDCEIKIGTCAPDGRTGH